MVILDEDGSPVADPDLSLGRLVGDTVPVTHRWVTDSEEEGHWETIAEYENGGMDVEWSVDSPETGHWETVGADGGPVEHFDGIIPDDLTHEEEHADLWTFQRYVPYTEEELEEREKQRQEAEAEAGRKRAIDEGCQAFFIDGGKTKMEQDIEDAATSGGTDPQLQAIARMQVMTMDLEAQPSSAVAEFRDYWPEWQPDTAYGFQQPLQYDGRYFRTSQALTSSSTYPPGSSESLYYEVEIAPDGVIVYRTCHGSYDAVQKGETRHYPDADGPIYRSKVDNNAYAPDVVPGNWELVSDAGTK